MTSKTVYWRHSHDSNVKVFLCAEDARKFALEKRREFEAEYNVKFGKPVVYRDRTEWRSIPNGQTIRHARERLSMEPDDFARKLNISEQQLQHIETGNRSLSCAAHARISNWLPIRYETVVIICDGDGIPF
jgi:DNA-binding transcriptional regulator YiaG